MSGFDGTRVVVTGAARGIGAAVAGALAAAGARVGMVDAAADRLAGAVARIEQAGGRAVGVPADVGDEAAVARAFEQLAAELEGIDALACFAGVVGYAAAPDCAEEEWDRIMRVNAKGPFLCAKHAIPHLRRRGGGAILFTSSVMAFAAEPTTAAYSASKGAVEAMTRAIALDHAAEGIRVNCIAPGVVRTDLLGDAAAYFGIAREDPTIASWGERHPLGRLIEPAEVADVALFLLSERASAVTGSCYPVDGGLLGKLG